MYNANLKLDNFIHANYGLGKEKVGGSNLVRSIMVATQKHLSGKECSSDFEGVNPVYTVMISILKNLQIGSEEDLIHNVPSDTLKDLADQTVTSINGLYLRKILDLKDKVSSRGESATDIANSVMIDFKNGRDECIIERYLTLLQYAPRGLSFCPGTPIKDSFVILSETTLKRLFKETQEFGKGRFISKLFNSNPALDEENRWNLWKKSRLKFKFMDQLTDNNIPDRGRILNDCIRTDGYTLQILFYNLSSPKKQALQDGKFSLKDNISRVDARKLNDVYSDEPQKDDSISNDSESNKVGSII